MPVASTDSFRLPNELTVIPRLRWDPFLISEYAAAMRLYGGWGDFPPAVVDQEWLVIGGTHRIEAAIQVGVEAVPYEMRDFVDARDRLLFAASDNATHGRRWATKDMTAVVLFADRIGVEPGELAEAMRVRVEKIERVPVTTVVRTTPTGTEEQRAYAKRGVRHALRGRVLTEAEEVVMKQLTTPNLADAILLDLLRLDQLDALPQLTVDSYRSVIATQDLLARWVERDRHLLEAA